MKDIYTSFRGLGYLLLFLFAGVSSVNGQIVDQQISMNEQMDIGKETVTIQLEDALKQVEGRYDVSFVYKSNLLDGMHVEPGNLPQSDEFGAELQQLLDQFNLVYSNLNERTIIIKKGDETQITSEQVAHLVEGVVRDAETRETMPGVNVTVKGTTQGTSSNIYGEYSLNTPAPNDTLIFSFIGYQRQEVPVEGRNEIDIEMQPSTITGDEVVVIGFGSQDRESVVAGITSITERDLARTVQVPSLSMALTGKLPGVVTVSSTGLPGEEEPQIFVRGSSTWQDSSPLILVDGIERSINNVDMSSVASVTVLKDASATAVYGVQGANGVILIETKSGYEGQFQITGSFENTVKAPSQLPGVMDSYDTLMLRNEAIVNELGAPNSSWGEYYTQDFVNRYQLPQSPEDRIRYANVDWSDELFRDYTQSYNANLNVRGGSDAVQFFASANYVNEGDLFKEFENSRGYQPGFGFQRLNARSNLDFQLSPSTKVSAKLAGSYGVRKRPWGFSGGDYGFWVAAYSASPTQYLPVYPDGSFGFDPDATGGSSNSVQILALSGVERITSTELTTNFELDQDLDMFVPGLNLQGQIAVDNTFIEGNRGINDLFNSARNRYIDPISGAETFQPLYDTGTQFDFQSGTLWNTSGGDVNNGQTYRKLYYQVQLNYEFGLGEKHNFTEMALFNRSQDAVGSIIPRARENWVFRSTYNYDQRYIVEYNGSYNGSEKFGAGYRFGFFSSGGIGWNIHRESFMDDVDFVDNLKIRASYGTIGDDNTNGRWLYRSEWAYGGNTGLGTVGITAPVSPYTWYRIESLGNPDVRWATVTKANLGIDFGFFKGVVSGSFDIFRDKREDILISGAERAIPSYFGQQAPVANLGEVENQGFEISLNLNQRFDNGLGIWTEFSATHAENKVIERDDPELTPAYQKEAGYAVGQARTHIDNGFFDSWDDVYASTPYNTNDASKLPGGRYVIDYNSDGIIDDQDSVPYGYSGTPQNTFNTTVGFDWKGISGYAQFYGVNNVNRWTNFGSLGGNELAYAVDGGYWSMDNPDANTQMPRWNTSVSGYSRGSRWMYDGSFLRLKTAQIGYTFDANSRVANIMGVSSLNFYLNGHNLLLWTDMPDDRESNFAGGAVPSQGAYPTVKRFNLGVNVNF